jgi:hypothetical protein
LAATSLPAFASNSSKATTEPALLFAAFRFSGNRPPEPSGLQIAIWDDGVVLRGRNPKNPGEDLEWATLSPGEVQRLKSEFDRYGLFKLKTRSSSVPDAGSYKFIGLTGDKLTSATWDEHVAPGWGANVKPDEDYRSLVAAWMQTKISVCSCKLTDTRPVTDADKSAPFRGYNWNSPFETAWLRTK